MAWDKVPLGYGCGVNSSLLSWEFVFPVWGDDREGPHDKCIPSEGKSSARYGNFSEGPSCAWWEGGAGEVREMVLRLLLHSKAFSPKDSSLLMAYPSLCHAPYWASVTYFSFKESQFYPGKSFVFWNPRTHLVETCVRCLPSTLPPTGIEIRKCYCLSCSSSATPGTKWSCQSGAGRELTSHLFV